MMRYGTIQVGQYYEKDKKLIDDSSILFQEMRHLFLEIFH